MGLFSGSKKIYVASSAYNVAGDEINRPHFLKNTIVSNVLTEGSHSLGESINAAYRFGPGIKLRSFFKWALINYDTIGIPQGTLYAEDIVNSDVVVPFIPKEPGESIWVQSLETKDADYLLWVEQYMLKNHPELIEEEWTASIDNDTYEITITFKDNLFPDIVFQPDNYDPEAEYLWVLYTAKKGRQEGSLEIGDLETLEPGEPFPDLTDYELDDSSIVSRTEALVTTVETLVTYSDGRPDEQDEVSSTQYVDVDRLTRKYIKEDNFRNNPDTDLVEADKYILYLFEDKKKDVVVDEVEDVEEVGGVTITTKTTTTTEFLVDDNSYREDFQPIILRSWSVLQGWLYKLGSGIPELDGLQNLLENYGSFYPIIPIRYKNSFVHDRSGWEDEVAQIKKAVRKGTDGGSYNKLVDKISESGNTGDMDHIYLVYGVSLNVIDQAARKYIYQFMKRLMIDHNSSSKGAVFLAQYNAYMEAFEEWLEWRRTVNTREGAYGPEPEVPPFPKAPRASIRIASKGQDGTKGIDYDIRIHWSFIIEHEGTGKAKPSAKTDEIWLERKGSYTEPYNPYTGDGLDNRLGPIWFKGYQLLNTERIHIYHQYEENKYRYLEVVGLIHQNRVYKGESVYITGHQALLDEDESGFIIPLHDATFRQTPLVDATQMGTACIFLVINSYEVVKQKWYESSFFKIVVVVAVVVVSAIFSGGAGVGLLGSHMAVGMAMGMSGVAASMVGAIANALAAMLLTTVISKFTENLGAIGPVVAAVISMAITASVANFHATGSFGFDFGQLMRADNILKLADAAGRGYQAYVEEAIQDMQSELQDLQSEAKSITQQIQELMYGHLNRENAVPIDPMMYVTDSTNLFQESRDSFLARTLMTGPDVAQMSFDLLNDFAKLNLTLPDAFV